jgi:hypothetical protein
MCNINGNSNVSLCPYNKHKEEFGSCAQRESTWGGQAGNMQTNMKSELTGDNKRRATAGFRLHVPVQRAVWQRLQFLGESGAGCRAHARCCAHISHIFDVADCHALGQTDTATFLHWKSNPVFF